MTLAADCNVSTDVEQVCSDLILSPYSTFREKKGRSWCVTQGRQESTPCQSSPKHQGKFNSLC